MRPRVLRAALGLAALAILGLCLTALHRELAHVHYHQVAAELRALPTPLLLLAVVLAAASYACVGVYDWLALRFAGRPQPLRTGALVGFLATAFSNTVGFALLSGGTIRYRFYSAAGLQATDTVKVVGFVSSTLWLGFLTLAGIALNLAPPAVLPDHPAALASPRLLGGLFLLVVLAYVVLVTVRRRPIEVRGLAISLPAPRVALAQIAVSSLDWLLAGGTLAVLLHGCQLPVAEVLAVFLLAQIIGLVSHVPGGVGVFESLFLLGFSGRAPVESLLGALVAFRIIYYLVPFVAAVVTLAAIEVARRRHVLVGALGTVSRWATSFVPSLFAVATFIAGAILLASGATPSVPWRASVVRKVVGLPVIETSHLAASIVGVLLLVLARGLQRRLDGAYVVTLALLIAGSILSLLKALDWEEALALAVLALALAPFRQAFYRRASLLADRLSAPWVTALACVLAGTTWLGLFAHKHVEYSNELWWRFALGADASRFLRATVAVAVVVLILALDRLLAGARLRVGKASGADLAAVGAVLERAPEASAHLALTGDKSFLFNEARSGFVMFAPSGRSLVAMGDPVGPPEARRELVWRFHDLADRQAAHTVFYEVDSGGLPLYVDLGLQLQKLGEEATVDLAGFSLEGGEHRSLRASFNRVEKEALRFEVVPPAGVRPLLPRLQEVSDAWLAGKNTREKSFSLGAFEPRYIASCPVVLLWKRDQLVAFANLWQGADRRELSVDLMRFGGEAPAGTMDYLFIRLLLWGRAQGFASFNLGMAPLSGLEQIPRSPLWSRLAALLYQHGEHFYNFQGIRAYKQKFRPTWRPRYLACPGGVALPVVVANLASLVSGGLLGVVGRRGSRPGRRLPSGDEALVL